MKLYIQVIFQREEYATGKKYSTRQTKQKETFTCSLPEEMLQRQPLHTSPPPTADAYSNLIAMAHENKETSMRSFNKKRKNSDSCKDTLLQMIDSASKPLSRHKQVAPRKEISLKNVPAPVLKRKVLTHCTRLWI